jgi:hypothetical protein
MTPRAIQPGDKTYSHSFEYEMLAQTTAKACASPAELEIIHGPRFTDPATVGHPALFERAKYEAIVSVKGADGLVGVSAKVELVNGNECVTVLGRAYAIRVMRDGPPLSSPTSTEGSERRAPRRIDENTLQPIE